mmetsp:Transcript_27256/g.70653  ORF Transcript_27256/g.70653 Transcript_27256/m.70653 type:complete len:202 (+) Transcript_27256:1663-2268(+)
MGHTLHRRSVGLSSFFEIFIGDGMPSFAQPIRGLGTGPHKDRIPCINQHHLLLIQICLRQFPIFSMRQWLIQLSQAEQLGLRCRSLLKLLIRLPFLRHIDLASQGLPEFWAIRFRVQKSVLSFTVSLVVPDVHHGVQPLLLLVHIRLGSIPQEQLAPKIQDEHIPGVQLAVGHRYLTDSNGPLPLHQQKAANLLRLNMVES